MHAHLYFGSHATPGSGAKERHNPYSGAVVSTFPECSKEEVHKALLIAQKALPQAKAAPLHRRIAWMHEAADALESRKEFFARLITDEVAKPIRFARIEVERACETIRLTALASTHLQGRTIPTDIMPSGREATAFYLREPAGVIVAITPFNFPLNLAAHKLAPALFCGNTVVFKPTPEAPRCAYELAKIFIESPSATPDALSLVYGDAEVGSALVSSSIPRVISFTGSVGVGKIITQQAGIKRLGLELGGNAACYIHSSANRAHAAKRCAMGAFVNSGQVCISLQRLYVDASIHEEFADLLAKETASLSVGDPYAEETFMSALINEESALRAERWIKSAVQEGAKLVCGGIRKGRIITPTVLTEVHDSMPIVCEEVFAPIVSLVKVSGFEDALERINHSPYGLQAALFTNDLSLARRAITEFACGGVVVNDIPTLRFDVQPYGGIKLSGIGREGPAYAIEEFTEIKSVVMV